MITYQQLLRLHEADKSSNIESLQLFYRSLYEVRDKSYISSTENDKIIFQFEINNIEYYILKDDYNTKILGQENYQDYIDWHKNKINYFYKRIMEIEEQIEATKDKIRRGLI